MTDTPGGSASPPVVFISYAWEDDAHEDWVQSALAERLRRDGCDARLDKWEAVPGDDLAMYMERAVRESDHVLVVCTPAYRAKMDVRAGGVGYEGRLMAGEFFGGAPAPRKFVPVLRVGSEAEAIPSWIRGVFFVDLRGEPDSRYEEQYEQLLAMLHDVRPALPPIGPKPSTGRFRRRRTPDGSHPPVTAAPDTRPAAEIQQSDAGVAETSGVEVSAPELEALRAAGAAAPPGAVRWLRVPVSNEALWPLVKKTVVTVVITGVLAFAGTQILDWWKSDRKHQAEYEDAMTKLYGSRLEEQRAGLRTIIRLDGTEVRARSRTELAEWVRWARPWAGTAKTVCAANPAEAAPTPSGTAPASSSERAWRETVEKGLRHLGAPVRADSGAPRNWLVQWLSRRGANERRIDLSHSDLRELNLDSLDLRGANLQASCLFRVSLRHAKLAHALLDTAVLDNAMLDEADLDSASFRSARLSHTRFVRAKLRWANLEAATGTSTVFNNADLTAAVMDAVTLHGASFSNATLICAKLTRALLDSVNWSSSKVRWVRFDYATILTPGARTFDEIASLKRAYLGSTTGLPDTLRAWARNEGAIMDSLPVDSLESLDREAADSVPACRIVK